MLAATAGSQTSDAAGICPCTLVPLTSTPTATGLSTANGRPGGPWTLELGVKFNVDAAARLSTFSFYKDAGETGAHVGRLWTADGVLLASVPFGAETASGWQQQALTTPIELAPGTTYVASVGFNASFVQTIGGLAAPVGSGPLHSVADGHNGVFADAAGSFPTQSFNSSNYFVNVEVLDDGVPAAPTLASTSPVNGATGVALGAAASAVVTRDLDATSVTSGATLERSDGAPVAAAVAYDSAARRITITPTAQLDPLTTYVARLSTAVAAADGTPFAGPVSWRFTTGNVAPTIVARSPAVGATGVSIDSSVTVTFSRDMDPATLTTATFTLVNGAPGNLAGSVVYDAATRTATLTPSHLLVGGKVYTARVDASVRAADGVQFGTATSWSFTATCPCMLLPPGLVPGTTGLSTANGRPGGPWTLELGVKFTVDTPTQLASLSFYKDAAETGSHVGHIWTGDGILLENVPFAFETASGLQKQPLPTPLWLAPGITYVASVGMNNTFVQTLSGLAAPLDSGPLHSVADGQNGVFADSAGTFPTKTFASSNYFVDVEASPAETSIAEVSATIATTQPANGALNVPVGTTVSATLTRPLDPASITVSTVTLTKPDGTVVPAGVASDAAAGRITLTPAAPLDPITTYTARLSTGVRTSDGVPLASDVSWSFTTQTAPPTITAQSPAAGATGVATDSPISITFSRDMDPASITASTFTVSENGDGAITGTIAYDAGTHRATFTPTSPLLTSTGYTVRVDGGVRSADAVTLTAPVVWSFTTALGSTVRINSGGGNYTSTSGSLFAADANFNGGLVYSVGNAISGTSDTALYQNERYGTFSYAIPVANGRYDVRLHFIELYYGRAAPGCEGKRIFSIDLLDTPASPDISNLDICSEVGSSAADPKLIRNVVVRDGVLDIQSITGAADDPEVAAIEVLPVGTPLGDIDPPSAPTNLIATAGLSKATLSWQAASDNVGVTVYDVYRGTTSGFTPTFSTRIAQTATPGYVDAKLAAGTYYYVVRAEDDAGNRGPFSNQATAAVVADQPPTVPGSLVATGGIGQASLTWNASTDDDGLAPKYDVFRGTVSGFTPSSANRIARVATIGYVDKGLAAGTYYYVVKAIDSAGLASAPSTQASATVTADTTPPSVAVTAPAANATVGGVITLTATASDNVGVKGVQFKIDGLNAGPEVTAGRYSIPYDTTTVGNTGHVVTAVARDTAGNTATSAGVSITVSNAAPPPPGTGLVGAWGFPEGAGTTTADASGNGNTATLENALFGTGHTDGGLRLNGTNARATVAESPSLDLTTGLTLEAWVNPSALGTLFRTIVLKERGTTGLAYALYAGSDANTGQPSIEVYTGGDSILKGPVLPLNAWSHLAGTYDGTSLRLYVNGTLVATKSAPGSVVVTTDPLRMGGNAIWGEYFAGALDDVRVYNRALTGGEIVADLSAPV